jgi:hypothetical protein
VKVIKKIVINTIPKNQGSSIDPYLEILDGKNYDVLWTDNPKYKDKNKGNKKAIVFNDVKLVKNYIPGDDQNSM